MDARCEAELRNELMVLNAEVTAILAKRKAWMDAHMPEFAKVQVGESIYDLDTGRCLGIVSELYRYWDNQNNPLYDTSMDVCYQYNKGNNIFDNTSRRHVRIGSKSDLDRERELRSNLSSLADVNWDKIFGSATK